MSLMIDLFSGLGGASQPFVDAGWSVIRVDFNPVFRPTVIADALHWPLKPRRVDLLWASIPCVGFARAAMPWFPDETPSLELAEVTREIIRWHDPEVWIVECNRASRKYLSPLFGQVRVSLPGHAIWSNRLFLVPNYCGQKERLAPSSDRAALRGKIPIEIAGAIFGQLR